MCNRVLFVDDDRSLLRTIERNLCFDLELSTADGGRDAIDKAETQGPFSVIVVDMQMPGMDGIQTINELRKRLPQAVFVMLTGNQDATTAIQAVNIGRVFRFLSKPCEMDEIKQAILDAQELYNTTTGEKDLLVDTMLGSIKVLTEFAELSCDRLVKPDQMRDRFLDLVEALDLQQGSQDLVACKVLTVGLASMTEHERKRLRETPIFLPEHKQLMNKLCQHSASLVAQIPQFVNIAELLLKVSSAETLSKQHSHVEITATLLRIVFYWSLLENNGSDRSWIATCLQRTMPAIADKYWTCVLHELGCSVKKIPRATFLQPTEVN